jgi:hypothetical protein
MSAAREQQDQVEADANANAWPLNVPSAEVLAADNARLRLENASLLERLSELETPPEKWLPLKVGAFAAGAIDAGGKYENPRKWCERGVVVAEKRGGRWFVRMDSLQAHVAALRAK